MNASDPRVVRALLATARAEGDATILAEFANLGDGDDVGAGADATYWATRGDLANAARAGAGLPREPLAIPKGWRYWHDRLATRARIADLSTLSSLEFLGNGDVGRGIDVTLRRSRLATIATTKRRA